MGLKTFHNEEHSNPNRGFALINNVKVKKREEKQKFEKSSLFDVKFYGPVVSAGCSFPTMNTSGQLQPVPGEYLNIENHFSGSTHLQTENNHRSLHASQIMLRGLSSELKNYHRYHSKSIGSKSSIFSS